MDVYMFKPNRELLELNAMEMDKGLVTFFEAVFEGEAKSRTFDFTNDEGVTRKLQVNVADKLLQGRGIKGFFAPYSAADYLFISRHTGDTGHTGEAGHTGETGEKISISAYSGQVASDWKAAVNETPGTIQRIEEVLQAIKGFKAQDEAWFRLYDASRQFSLSRLDELICLPHLPELQPLQYQIRTVKSVIARFKGRALLCDEVGLGKTVEAGICMQEYIMRGLARKILVLVPPSLVNQWHEEMKRKFNQDFIRSDDPEFMKRGAEAWGHYPKVIASISTAKRANHSRVIEEIAYDLVIVDEAHHVKNRNTVAWKFVNSLKKKYMLLLTATPVQNSLEELYNLITLLKPGQLKTYQHFRSNFVKDNQGIEVKNTDKLKALLSEVMIRNRRSNVDIAFTKRKAHTTIVTPSEQEQLLYLAISRFIREHYEMNNPVFSRFLLKNMQEQMGSSFSSLTGSLHKLAKAATLDDRQQRRLAEYADAADAIALTEAAGSAKITELCAILKAFGDKMLVFTKYRATQELLAMALRDQGFKVAEFHGGLMRKDKEREIAFFREDANVLVSTEVGGEGRNLQFCNGIVNFDLPWNPMAIEQRIGRIHRIGQTRDVFVYNLAARHTLEHHMLNVLDRKINMFELVVGEVDMILGDIEEGDEFSELVMNAWVRSGNDNDMEQEMDKIGEQLMKNKQQLQRVKELDDRLFM